MIRARRARRHPPCRRWISGARATGGSMQLTTTEWIVFGILICGLVFPFVYIGRFWLGGSDSAE